MRFSCAYWKIALERKGLNYIGPVFPPGWFLQINFITIIAKFRVSHLIIRLDYSTITQSPDVDQNSESI